MTKSAPDALPDLLTFCDGSAVTSAADWQRRREEISRLIVNIEYGGLPSTPGTTSLEVLHRARVCGDNSPHFVSCRVQTGPEAPFSFLLTLTIPQGDGPFPVVINGDACWRYVTDEVAGYVTDRGFILAQFNRVEIASDIHSAARDHGIYLAYPNGTYGALAAWAWGYHRCVDALITQPFVDPSRIAITGHSRGGKTVLLAGATDDRIALTTANNSGAGGAGCFRHQGPNSETLAGICHNFPHWFGPELEAYGGRENELPFDQHFLKALHAPRALLTMEALEDLWANPSGTWLTHCAATAVYDLLNVPDRINVTFRDGTHKHSPADWLRFLDVMEWQLCGKPKPAYLGPNPFSG